MIKDKVLRNWPIYLGFSIFDLSRITCTVFITSRSYQIMGARPNWRTPTHWQFCLSNLNEEYLRWYSGKHWRFRHFRLSSNLSITLKEERQKLRKFKDECNSLQPHEFIRLRSQIYSLKFLNGRIKITTKRVSKVAHTKEFELYRPL